MRLFALFLVVFFCPTLAMAQATQPISDAMIVTKIVLDHLLDILGGVLMLVVSLYIPKLVSKAEQVGGIKISKEREEYMIQRAREAVHYADEWAHKKLGAGVKVTGEGKLAEAVRYLSDKANGAKLDEKAASAAADYILSALGETRTSHGVTKLKVEAEVNPAEEKKEG